MSTTEAPQALIDAIGADFQDGTAVWFWPEAQTDGFTDVMIWHEPTKTAALYIYDHDEERVARHGGWGNA